MASAKILRLPGGEVDAPFDPSSIIEDYLDHLCLPLVGIVPYARRERLRREARADIEQCMEVRLLDGENPREATYGAIDEYGDSAEVGEAFLEEWLRYLPKGGVAKNLGLPVSYAFFFFIQASLWGLVMIQIRFFNADPQPYTFGLSYARFRQIYPEPFPMPQNSGLWLTLLVYSFVAPFIAGWLTGWKALTCGAKSVVTVMPILVCLSFLMGTFMLPQTDALWFGIVQLVWWLPIGAVTAEIAGVLARRRRFRFQPNWRKKSL